jgi:trimethylamine--corrinoid protein Co-methyltransferase
LQTRDEVRALGELVQIACPDGKITVGISPVSPLTFPDGITEAILETAQQGFVLGPLPCPILGATAPMSIAGGLVQQNAEVLASNTLAQTLRPGTPIIYKGRLSVMNPYSGLSVWGNPEIGLISAATVQLGHYYGVPVDVYGFCTDSHIPDIQNGYERAINAMVPVLAGAEEISGIGEMEGGLSSSFAQIAIDDEIIFSIKRIANGVKLDDERLGVSLIDKVMDGSHNFLAEKHTLKYLREGEVIHPNLALRNSWSQWEKTSRSSIIDQAEEKATKLIEESPSNPLEDRQLEEFRKVIQAYKKT